jgi:hypothetical protein
LLKRIHAAAVTSIHTAGHAHLVLAQQRVQAKAQCCSLPLAWLRLADHLRLTEWLLEVQVRRQVLGPNAPPLLVVGPRPLRRALHAYAQLEPLTFVYLDNAHTLVRAQSHTCSN